jgi:uncharacterized membrane protein YedE/YeeE
MKRTISALLAGGLFGVGLVIAGMTQPAKVVGFLDFFGDWDPSLAFVMGGAMVVYIVGFRLVVRRGRPLLDAQLHLPTRRDIDLPLIAGATLFGAGWGLAGYCPGPGFVSLGSWATNAIIFVVAMIVGMALHQLIIVRRVFHGLFQKGHETT